MSTPQTQIAAVLPKAGPSPVAEVHISTDHPVPGPGNEDILVKLEYSGVCHSDVHSIRGETPMSTDVAGHEGIGNVVQGMYVKLEGCSIFYFSYPLSMFSWIQSRRSRMDGEESWD